MLKASVGHSIMANSYEAGKEAISKAMKKVKEPKIVLVFCSVLNKKAEVIDGIRSVIDKKIPIIGCTSSGSIMVPTGNVTSANGYVGVMLLEDENLTIGMAGKERIDENPRDIGREVATKALRNAHTKETPNYCLMIGTPTSEEEYMNGIQDIIGDVPIFGCSASDNTIMGDWKVIAGGESFNEGLAVAFFYTNKKIAVEFNGSYTETYKSGIITKIEGKRKLLEIDGIPALKKIGMWLNTNPDQLIGTNLLLSSCNNPIGVKDPLGKMTLVRLPWIGLSDYSIKFGNDLTTNTCIFGLEATPDDIILASKEAILNVNEKLGGRAKAYLLFFSLSRKFGLGDRLHEIQNDIKNIVGSAPFIVVFTFGEYGYGDHTGNLCGTSMMSYIGFGK